MTAKEHHRALVCEILGSAVRLIHIDCPLEVCISRDVKGLYAKATVGHMPGMTGIQDDFETPLHPDAVIPTHEMTVAEAVAHLAAVVVGC